MSFCAFGEKCLVFDSALNSPGVCYSAAICEGCRNRCFGELNMLRLDYVDLTQRLPRRAVLPEVRIARSKPQSAMPMDLQVFTLRHWIAHAVVLADGALRDTFGPPGPRWAGPVREAVALDHALRHLQARLVDVAALGEVDGYWNPSAGVTQALSGPGMLLLFGDLHFRARRLLGIFPTTITVPGMCPQCGAAALQHFDDTPEKIHCRVCASGYSRQKYAEMVELGQ